MWVIKSISFLILAIFYGVIPAKAQDVSLTKKEIKMGWALLFNGKTFDGWRQANGATFTGKGWKIENGVLSTNPENEHGADIITDKEFSDFELSIDFKLAKGTNSGVKYCLIKNTSLGCEYQLIDDANHPDAKLGRDGNRSLGAVYDILPPSAAKKSKPIGEWNTLKIILKNKHVEHWLNGKKILVYELESDDFKKHVDLSKFKTTKGFAEANRSAILLQDHGDVIYFRNIKIREL